VSDAPVAAALKRPSVWHNWISLTGAIIAAGAVFSFLFLTAMDLLGLGEKNPYLGILSYMVAPAFLILGIVLGLAGAFLQHRQRRRNPGAAHQSLSIDLSRPRDRWILTWFSVGAMAFALLSATGSYQTYHYTESVQFCGQVCHTVMQPEFVAYENGAHARVACAECHIGSGAAWYVKAKISGLHQVYAVLTNKYDRPIPTPVQNLRPARETCEQCHWPEKYSGSVEHIHTHYLSDDKNTPFTVRLLVNVGGGSPAHGPAGGIHWHMLIQNKIEYFATDPQRQTIPWVRMTAADGRVTIYRSSGFKGDPAPESIRRMDCMDCHNRPAHKFQSPDEAVDEAMYLGRIDASLPAVKRTAVDLLTRKYATQAAAFQSLSGGLSAKYPGARGLPAAITAVEGIYARNFFPEMNTDWSSHPDNIGHLDSQGCFRCHDGKHTAAGGGPKATLAMDCNSCHTIIAQGSGADLTRLGSLGAAFKHPTVDIEGMGMLCSDCHNGKNQDN